MCNLNRKGFSLLEVIIVSAIMVIVTAALGQLMVNQGKALTRSEDRASAVALKNHVEEMLRTSPSCLNSIGGMTLNLSPTNLTPVTDLKDFNNLSFLSTGGSFDFLQIGQISFRNVNVTGLGIAGQGNIEIVVPVVRSRDRNRGQLAPIAVRMLASLGPGNQIVACSDGGIQALQDELQRLKDQLQQVESPTSCRKVTHRGGAPSFVSMATCGPNEYLRSGFGACEVPGSTLCGGTTIGFLHLSYKMGNSWVADCYGSGGEACSEATAICCQR